MREHTHRSLEPDRTPDVRVTSLGDGLLLISVPVKNAPLAGFAGLTDAEAEVASLAASGLSNAEIAQRRGASQRTIANQLASVYLKLGVGGRRGLRAFLREGDELRLRRQLDELISAAGDPTEGAEAILSHSTRIEHATGGARSAESQEALRDGLVRIEAARKERGADASRAIDLWSGPVCGRWSLIEHFERSGRRYFLAFRNDPKLGRSRALTERELQVWSYAAMGQSNKLIAYTLGLPLPTVASTLRQARRKLGGDVGPQLLASLAEHTPEAPIPEE